VSSAIAGDDWVSATARRNYLLNNPLIDWLERFGEEKGFAPDADLPGYDPALEFAPFIMSKGIAFEAPSRVTWARSRRW
jgi:hypothetical protein